jgi:hypothetical protein
LNSENVSLAFTIMKIKNNIIKKYVKENVPPDKILKHLKEIQLNDPSDTIEKIKNHISKYMSLQWSDENKSWVSINNVSYISMLAEEDPDIAGILYNFKLSRTDSATLIKDIKEILTSIKKITKDLPKIIEKVDLIASSIILLSDGVDNINNSDT